jgi:predicted nucleic acid-binding protein
MVIDASAVVLGLLNDADARRVMTDEALAVPDLVDSEVAHALRGQVARGVISEATASQALGRWARVGVIRFAAVGLLSRVWELRGNVSAYDGTYVALAESLDCHLVTADARLGRAPGPHCPITVLRS